MGRRKNSILLAHGPVNEADLDQQAVQHEIGHAFIGLGRHPLPRPAVEDDAARLRNIDAVLEPDVLSLQEQQQAQPPPGQIAEQGNDSLVEQAGLRSQCKGPVQHVEADTFTGVDGFRLAGQRTRTPTNGSRKPISSMR